MSFCGKPTGLCNACVCPDGGPPPPPNCRVRDGGPARATSPGIGAATNVGAAVTANGLLAPNLHIEYKIRQGGSMPASTPQTRSDRDDQLQRPALHHQLVDRLTDLIADGSLPPGDRINERALCERFGVSRTPLREAVAILARQGLVTLLPRRGSRVAVHDAAQVHDIIEVLGALESLARQFACQRATNPAIAAVAAAHDEMLEHFEARDMLAYFRVNERIHDLIVASAGNAELVSAHRALRARVLRALYMPNGRVERWRAAVGEHQAFVDSLVRRDGARLSRLLREHKERTWTELRPWLEQQGHAASS